MTAKDPPLDRDASSVGDAGGRATANRAALVPLAGSAAEPAHEHADLRFVLATGVPEAARPESPAAALRWLSLPEALAGTPEPNLRETLTRVRRLLAEYVPRP